MIKEKIKTFWAVTQEKIRGLWSAIQKWYYFQLANPVVRKGEKGGFKWCFRRYWLSLETLSGNFKVRFTASEHPYGYLLSSRDDSQIEGFCQVLYSVGKMLTTEQQFVDDVVGAVNGYNERLMGKAEVVEDELEEKIALEEEKKVQEYVEKPKRSTAAGRGVERGAAKPKKVRKKAERSGKKADDGTKIA